jgi:hypothetical protein
MIDVSAQIKFTKGLDKKTERKNYLIFVEIVEN